MFWEMNCSKNSFLVSRISDFDDKNVEILALGYLDAKWIEVTPDSIGDTVKKVLCNKKRPGK